MVQMRMEGFKKLGDDLERVIEKDDSNSSVNTESEEGKIPPKTCREQLRHILHTNKFQIGVICLVIVDCLLVITELLIDLEALKVEKDNPVPHVLHYMSIGILSVFLIEIVVKVYAMRLDFFKHKMEMFDALVVIVSFALDVAFANQEGLQSGAGLLIVLRLWRITRILNGIVLSVKAQAERRLLRERRVREAVEQELAKFREYCSAQEREIEVLQALLKKHSIDFQATEKPVVVSKIDVVAEVNELSDKMHMELDSEKESPNGNSSSSA